MNAFPCIRRIPLCPEMAAAVLAFSIGVGAGPASAQEACLKGCAYPGYPGMAFTLGDGFVSKGGEVKVTHMGFLGQVYNNDGISPRKVGVPNYIGELSVLDPVTGEDRFLFRNQQDWVTHANDSGKVVSLGVFPKGAPIVFKYVNVDGKEKSYKTFARYSGDNLAGAYDFNSDPLLRNLAINGKPKPVSGGSWDWEGKTYNRWAVAASVPGTDEKQFQFEDADDRIFNDIVFRVSGVALVSETFKLDPPTLSASDEADGGRKVTLANAQSENNRGARLFYTTDGTVPSVDSSGNPQGATREYLSALPITVTTTIKAVAWKKSAESEGSATRFEPSAVVSATFGIVRLQWSKPTATPPGGAFQGNVSVTLAQAEGAKIYYRICDPGAPCDPPTASGAAYAGAPLILSGRKVLKVIAIQSSRDNSEVAEFAFTPVFKVSDAVYLDRNGDGRIESAQITVQGSPSSPPQSVSLADPFNASRKTEAAGVNLQWDSSVPSVLRADFAATPFTAGTGFAPGLYGAFKADGVGYDGIPFTIRDGAGPMVVSAVAEVSLDSGAVQRLIVTYSEAIRNPGPAAPFPLQVKRQGEDITSRLQVIGVDSIGDVTYRYSFGPGAFPVPGDSLRGTVLLLDSPGNPSNMASFIAVRGKPLTLTGKVTVSGGGCVKGGPIAVPRPLRIPVNVTIPRDPVSPSGCPEIKAPTVCLDCAVRAWKQADPGRPEAGSIPAGPELKVTTRWPFTFDLVYFNTLGEVVNTAKGEVGEEMLKAVAADAQGYKTVGLQWYPVSASGMQAATGAYIVKGNITTKAAASPSLTMGVPVIAPPVSERVLLRFGYVRD